MRFIRILIALALMSSSARALSLGGALAGHEGDFQAAGQAAGVDPILLESIAVEETNNGQSNALAQHNNVAGIMDPSTPNDTGFVNYATIQDGIQAEANLIQSGYISQGLTTISAIGAKYSPPGAANDPNNTNGGWPLDVASIYQQLGGTATQMGTATPILMGNGVVGTGGTISNVTTPAIVGNIINKFQNAGQKWGSVLENGATSLFWLLATISLVLALMPLALRRADISDVIGEVFRWVLVTGFFFWLLKNGPIFAGNIIASLWQLGGQASGSGNSIYPAQLINLGLQIFQSTMNHIVWYQPESIFVPSIISIIILIVCALVSVNMILQLCAAWVVLYAGVIFLAFGGISFTREMAVSYFKTILGIGASLMTLQLIIGIGTAYLTDLAGSVQNGLNASQLASIMVAAIILAAITHQLPRMVAGIASGGGYAGHVGHMGIMSLIGAGFAGARFAGAGMAGLAGGAAAGAASSKLLNDRINSAPTGSQDSGSMRPINSPINSDPGSVRPPPSAPETSSQTMTQASTSTVTNDSSSEYMSPDEQRGFPPEQLDFGIPADEQPPV